MYVFFTLVIHFTHNFTLILTINYINNVSSKKSEEPLGSRKSRFFLVSRVKRRKSHHYSSGPGSLTI